MGVSVKKAKAAPLYKQGKALITKQHPDGSEESSSPDVGGEMFDETPASVSVNIGLTKNMGNYESLKFSVQVTVPCNNNKPAIEEAFAFAKEWVDGKVNEINAEVEELKG